MRNECSGEPGAGSEVRRRHESTGIAGRRFERFGGRRRWFQQAIEAQPDHPGAINNLAVLYAKIGQPNDAIAAFRYGIRMNPDDDELYLNLGRVYVMMGERDKARAVLGELMERKPGNATATNALRELDAR